MKSSSRTKKEQAIKDLQNRVKTLQSKLKKKKEAPTHDEFIRFKIEKSQGSYERIPNPDGVDGGQGTFLLRLDITALTNAVYVPISIASSQKPTGFIYHIEGTAEGDIYKTDISCRGEGVTKVKLGTLLYAKIPASRTANFRILIEIRGQYAKTYKCVIHRINYKLDPRDARYKRFDTKIPTKTVEFR
ncbi:MAG: hypothetical protein WDZ93_02060 [Candidatus Paceibacterota bacterium]